MNKSAQIPTAAVVHDTLNVYCTYCDEIYTPPNKRSRSSSTAQVARADLRVPKKTMGIVCTTTSAQHTHGRDRRRDVRHQRRRRIMCDACEMNLLCARAHTLHVACCMLSSSSAAAAVAAAPSQPTTTTKMYSNYSAFNLAALAAVYYVQSYGPRQQRRRRRLHAAYLHSRRRLLRLEFVFLQVLHNDALADGL